MEMAKIHELPDSTLRELALSLLLDSSIYGKKLHFVGGINLGCAAWQLVYGKQPSSFRSKELKEFFNKRCMSVLESLYKEFPFVKWHQSRQCYYIDKRSLYELWYSTFTPPSLQNDYVACLEYAGMI